MSRLAKGEARSIQMRERGNVGKERLIGVGRGAYALLLISQGILEVHYGAFRPALLPEWPLQLPGGGVIARIVGAVFVAAGVVVMTNTGVRKIALAVGSLFLASAVFCQLPSAVAQHSFHVLAWSGPFAALIVAGCSFLVAASSSRKESAGMARRPPDRVAALGRVCFCLTVLRYGLGHFLHTRHDAALIPAWIPWHTFWIYFTGAALVGSGAAILAGIYDRPIAVLLCTMIGLWVVLLHIPRAVTDPHGGQGNEIESAAQALADSGAALLIACLPAGYERRRAKSGAAEEAATEEASAVLGD